jgi:glycosyltransferase involved in cell wall biosynthesis
MPGTDEKLSLIIPVYRNEGNLPWLLAELAKLHARMPCDFEVVMVVDGSPDRCHDILSQQLPQMSFESRLLSLSRNFGSFSAVMAGMSAATGDYYAVLAADLQEPPELVLDFHRILSGGEADIAFGIRACRSDPWLTELSSNLFWSIYRKLVVREMPPGGVDVFACTRAVRDEITRFRELNTNLIALLFWVGFRRVYVPYERRERLEGKSAWTFRKKLKYCLDSVFNFTELPIQMLIYVGMTGIVLAIATAMIVLAARIIGAVPVQGYVPIILAITFFGALSSFGLGIIGRYLWLTLENTRGRPGFIIASHRQLSGNKGEGLLALDKALTDDCKSRAEQGSSGARQA